jgi:magnesium transporter
VLSKEALVGLLNGILLAILVGLVAWLWSGSIGIGGVIAGAMLATLIVGCFAGTAIPLVLTRLGVDPAIASSVFLTTVTDVIGFFTFLGLATLFLL